LIIEKSHHMENPLNLAPMVPDNIIKMRHMESPIHLAPNIPDNRDEPPHGEP
jgi:hypothetical protein